MPSDKWELVFLDFSCFIVLKHIAKAHTHDGGNIVDTERRAGCTRNRDRVSAGLSAKAFVNPRTNRS